MLTTIVLCRHVLKRAIASSSQRPAEERGEASEMGESISCSTSCAPNCLSREEAASIHEIHTGQQIEDARRRAYPIADPAEARLDWQMLGVRHAWRCAAQEDFKQQQHQRFGKAADQRAADDGMMSDCCEGSKLMGRAVDAAALNKTGLSI
eukprot:TRINITY_DN95571_c0_g1_i1.p1 TRINITY_DN95571_c0_g1~~TRINITY_DN95571_c0_g1_i1.p1  ORF type:complete len:151 (-),score=27.47 TRINITY_DN95571_c0_g1_i1:90-542(-)